MTSVKMKWETLTRHNRNLDFYINKHDIHLQMYIYL